MILITLSTLFNFVAQQPDVKVSMLYVIAQGFNFICRVVYMQRNIMLEA